MQASAEVLVYSFNMFVCILQYFPVTNDCQFSLILDYIFLYLPFFKDIWGRSLVTPTGLLCFQCLNGKGKWRLELDMEIWDGFLSLYQPSQSLQLLPAAVCSGLAAFHLAHWQKPAACKECQPPGQQKQEMLLVTVLLCWQIKHSLFLGAAV